MIGVFDSGVGGLTALRELRRLRPDLDLIYYADTAHLPYGTRSPDTLLRYARRSVTALARMGVEGVLVACGTVSSVVLPRLQRELSLPLWGVVEPAVQMAWHRSRSKRIGVLGTAATVRSRAFERGLSALGSAVTVSRACPLFVSLAENGFTAPTDPVAQAAVAHYLAPMRAAEVDTLILGCTHFPLLAGAISRFLPRVTLVGAGEASAAALCAAQPRVGHGELAVFATDDPQALASQAEHILGGHLPCPVRLAPTCKDL